jgi:hypothetical protein
MSLENKREKLAIVISIVVTIALLSTLVALNIYSGITGSAVKEIPSHNIELVSEYNVDIESIETINNVLVVEVMNNDNSEVIVYLEAKEASYSINPPRIKPGEKAVVSVLQNKEGFPYFEIYAGGAR